MFEPSPIHALCSCSNIRMAHGACMPHLGALRTAGLWWTVPTTWLLLLLDGLTPKKMAWVPWSAQAKTAASSAGWILINEAPDRGKCIVRKVECSAGPLQLGQFPNGPCIWRVHCSPVSVVVGLGCGSNIVQEPRIEACMRAMVDTGTSSLIWVGSQSEYAARLLRYLGWYAGKHLADAPPRQRWRQDVDTRSDTTKGNARFCMERLRDSYCYPGAVVRLILVTSDFHMTRARMIFHRATEAILRPAGHAWYLECRSCATPETADGQKYRKAAGRLEDQQRKNLLDGQEPDADVEKWK